MKIMLTSYVRGSLILFGDQGRFIGNFSLLYPVRVKYFPSVIEY